jgi:putative transposase
MSYVRIGRFIQSMTDDKFMKKQFKKHRMDLIDVVERAKESIPLRTVLKCFNISTTTYSIWVQELFAGCSKSAIDWCLVRQPQQLNANEITVMREMMTKSEYEHWPISSIAHFAKRNNLLHVSMSTWYKYSRILNLRRSRPKFPRAKRKEGIKATRPNQIWHADVTYFKTGLKQCYVYLVVDNFSRKILSWMVSEKLSAKNRLQTIEEAYENEFGVLQEDISLLVDGGTENHNKLVNDYVHLIPNLTKLRALQDIRFGNVQIEAHNKILKQSWLYRREIPTLEKLKQEVKAFVREFNTVRPHHAIGGLTPNEKHYEVEPYENYHYRKEQSEALKARIIGNKQNACGTCIAPKVGKCTF